MDVDALQDEVDEWVREGIITEAQAEAIRSRYEDEAQGRSRAVLALSVVGAALVLAGVTLFLATNWSDLSRPMRATVLIVAPTLAYVAGGFGYRRNAPRIGLALCALGTLLIGPSVFLFDDLFALALADGWLYLAWLTVALPVGHVLGSRTVTGFGLLVLVALFATLTEPADPAAAVGLLGVALFALGHAVSTPTGRGVADDRIAWTYRTGGVAITLATLLVLTTVEWRFARFGVEATATLFASGVGALAGVLWLFSAGRRDHAGWAVSGVLAVSVSVCAATLAPERLPELVGFAGIHAAALGGLVSTGYLGYRMRSRTLADLAALGGLIQTLSFVSATVVDELSGSVALVIAGFVLLAVGIGLERGRRSMIARFDASE